MNAPVSPNLEKLLIEAQQGNHDAKDRLAAWMLDEAQRLAGFALRDSKKTMGQSSLISNALLKLVRGDVISSAPNIAYLKGAIYKAVSHVLIDRYRKTARQKKYLSAGKIPDLAWLQTIEESNLDLQELWHALDDLQVLDPRKADVVRLRFFCGLSIKQIAEELGISESTVESDLRLARLWLFKRMGGGLD